jgi:hypothetical protein
MKLADRPRSELEKQEISDMSFVVIAQGAILGLMIRVWSRLQPLPDPPVEAQKMLSGFRLE